MDDGQLPAADLVLLKLEGLLREAWASWNLVTTLIVLFFGLFVIYPWLLQRDPDTHPLLLSRQSTPSHVRQPGESSVYRSQDVPFGGEFINGLNIKADGLPAWSRGRTGTLKDIWMQFASGASQKDASRPTKSGLLMTVHGKEDIVEHSTGEITKQIAIMGKYFDQRGAKRVALYIPNSIEFLVTLFSSGIYGQVPILIPYNQPHKDVLSMLESSKPDLIVAAAGSLPLEDLAKNSIGLKQIIWVTEKGNRHMDWSAVPSQIGGSLGISVWQDIIDERLATETGELLADEAAKSPDVIAFWRNDVSQAPQMLTFSEKNIIAGVGAQLATIPKLSQKIGPSDLFLPADSLSFLYPLVLTLTALYSKASVAFNSVAGQGVDFHLATRSIAPTVVVASAKTMKKLHDQGVGLTKGALANLSKWSQTRTLAGGVIPENSFLNGFSNPFAATRQPGKLRLIYVAEQAGVKDCPPMTSAMLSDLRIFTGARILYALTAAKVAGAVAQTKFYDYRVVAGKAKCAHFGPPLGSAHVKLVDVADYKSVEGQDPEGEIVVFGPSVLRGEAKLGVIGTFRGDHTLAYVQ